jgi:hypothetical protein
VTGTITGTQSGITVNVGPTTTVVVSGFTSPTTAGVAHNVTVTAEDAGGNVTTGYTGTVHLTSSDPAAVLPANYTFTGGDAGIHAFPVTLKTAGTQSITATDTVTGTITGTQSGITVNPAAATSLGLTSIAQPTPTLTCTGPVANLNACTSTGEGSLNGGGNAGKRTVTANIQLLDAYGNVATNTTGSSITVNVASSGSVSSFTPGSGTLTILNGQSTTTAQFTLVRNQGSPTSATMTAKIGGTTELTVTLSS